MNNEIIIYNNGSLELPVKVSPDKETVWLNRQQLSENYINTIRKYYQIAH